MASNDREKSKFVRENEQNSRLFPGFPGFPGLYEIPGHSRFSRFSTVLRTMIIMAIRIANVTQWPHWWSYSLLPVRSYIGENADITQGLTSLVVQSFTSLNTLHRRKIIIVLRTLVGWNSRLFSGFPGDILTEFQVIFSRQLHFLLEKTSAKTATLLHGN